MRKLLCIMLALLLLCGCGAPAREETTTVPTETEVTAVVGGTEVTFAPWEQAGLPAEGDYYLTNDVELTETVTVTGQLRLHLNGHTVNGAQETQLGYLFQVPAGSALAICESEGGQGAVVAPRSFTACPYVVSMFMVEGTVTIAGGAVDASAISLENMSNGTAFYVASGGVLNVEGGTVTGGATTCYSLDPSKNVPVDDTPADTPVEGETQPTEPAVTEPVVTEPEVTEPQELELFGKGGSIYVAPGGTFNMLGGTVQNGSAGLGGNVYLEEDEETPATMNMSGGVITAGETLFHGGNIYNAGVMHVTGGEISLGTAYNNGGNIVVAGTLEMTGGTIREGRCDAGGMTGKRGGNILVNGLNAVVHISNAQILDGNGQGKENFGGSICVMGQCAREFTITDTDIIGGMGHRGGVLYFGTLAKDVDPENLDFYMKNVTVSGGTCSYRGDNLCMDSDLKGVYVELTMDNCTIISDGAARETISLGAGAAATTWARLTMNGGSIDGGSVTLYVDSVLTANGTKLTMEPDSTNGQFIYNP